MGLSGHRHLIASLARPWDHGGGRLAPRTTTKGQSMPPVRPVAVVSTTIARTVHHFYAELMAELGAAGYAVHVVTSPGPEVSELRTRADEVHLIPMQRGISPWQDIQSLREWVSLLRRLSPRLIIGGTPKAALFSMVAGALVCPCPTARLLPTGPAPGGHVRVEPTGSRDHGAADKRVQPRRDRCVAVAGSRVQTRSSSHAKTCGDSAPWQ